MFSAFVLAVALAGPPLPIPTPRPTKPRWKNEYMLIDGPYWFRMSRKKFQILIQDKRNCVLGVWVKSYPEYRTTVHACES